MAKDRVITGIDIGTHYTYTVVCSLNSELPSPQVIGLGRVRSFGLRRGSIIDVNEAAEAVKASVKEAENSSGVVISKAFVSIGGSHIVAVPSQGVVAVSRADGEISHDDVERVLAAAQQVAFPRNKQILHAFPNEYVVDGEYGLHDVVGMNGMRLEANTLLVGAASNQIRSVDHVLEQNNIEADGYVLTPLASSKAVLSRRQKELGVLCLDIGGGTTDIAVFEEGHLIHTNVLPLGGDNITNDLAIVLRTNVDVAERVKREYGMALSHELNKRETIDLSKFDTNEKGTVQRKDVVEIMEARLGEIFDLVNKDLKRIGKEAFLPGGVVLVGGTAKVPLIVDLCKQRLRLPVQIGFPRDVEGIVGSVDDPSYATVLGLIFWAVEQGGYRGGTVLPNMPSLNYSVDRARRWLRAFLP